MRRPSLRRPALVSGAALVLALAAFGWWRLAKAPPLESLAVLPFESQASETDGESLSAGLTETLIDRMSSVRSLRVTARSTVFRLEPEVDPREAGRRLGVAAVLAGSFMKRGNRIAIAAELVDVATGARLWSERYDRPFAELLLVEESLVSGITSGLRLRLSNEERRTLSRHGTESLEAYELYLRGRHLAGKDTEADDLEALRLFQLATQKDPRFVEAHVGIAGTYMRQAGSGFTPPGEVWPRAEAELRKALALDPENVPARCGLVNLRWLFVWDWTGTDREFAELVDDPRVLAGGGFRAIAMNLWARGRASDAAELLERALRVDPGNLETRINRADFLAHARRLDEAIAQYRALAEAEPALASPHYGLADALKRKGDIAAAIVSLRTAYELDEVPFGTKALAGARTAQDYERAEVVVARTRAAELQAAARDGYVSPFLIARQLAIAGEREAAFASLDAALDERLPGLLYLKADRAWDKVRDDPRFAAAVRRVGIP
jgi:TolB-like protein